jgi:hypothetical protein
MEGAVAPDPAVTETFEEKGTKPPKTFVWLRENALTLIGSLVFIGGLLWLLKAGAAPRRVLTVGQVVNVPTTSGVVADTVQSFSIDTGSVLAGGGTDSWVGADGGVLVQATLATHGGVRLLAVPSNPVDLIFRNGFDP